MVTPVSHVTPCVCEGFYKMHASSPKSHMPVCILGKIMNSFWIDTVIFQCNIFTLLEIIETAVVAGHVVYLSKQCLITPQSCDHSRILVGTEVQLFVSFITRAKGLLCISHSGFQPTQRSKWEAPAPPQIVVIGAGDWQEYRSSRGKGESPA